MLKLIDTENITPEIIDAVLRERDALHVLKTTDLLPSLRDQIKEMLAVGFAAAPAVSAEPVARTGVVHLWRAPITGWRFVDEEEYETAKYNGYETRILYTAPQPSQQERIKELERQLAEERESASKLFMARFECGKQRDAAIERAEAAESALAVKRNEVVKQILEIGEKIIKNRDNGTPYRISEQKTLRSFLNEAAALKSTEGRGK